MHSILPVAQKIVAFLPMVSVMCARCDLYEESHIHLFRDCFSSHILWNDIFANINYPTDFNFDKIMNLDLG